MSLFLALSLIVAVQRTPAAVASSDPAFANVCAQILRAAKQQDFGLLLPVLDDYVDLGVHGYLDQRDAQRIVQTWPEDFGTSFWDDLRDVVQSSLPDLTDKYMFRRPGIVLGLRATDAGMKISAIVQDPKPRTKVMPVDVAASDPSLADVRAQINRAVARRDFNMLLPILGPKIRTDHDDASYTPREFVAFQKACAVDICGHFWRDLHDAVNLGMAKEVDESVVAPYTVVKLQPDLEDAVAITAARVALRSMPDAAAPVIEWLSFDLVKRFDVTDWLNDASPLRIDGFSYGWWQVVILSGKTGWVSEKYARGGFGMSVWFEKIDGKWKLIAIGRGD
jgi:hypothetical protein